MLKTNRDLQEDVLDELAYEPSVDASNIGVTAEEGVVTLTGTAKNYAEKQAAVHAAERVGGVKAVADEIKVELPSMHIRDDEDIARAAAHALEWDIWVPKHIKVKVDNGWITLEGEVNQKYQQMEAAYAVRNLTGVKGVTNLINIKKPAVKPSDVKTKVDTALRRAAELDAEQIKVEVVNDKVILRGNVHTWAEREVAEHAAWAAPGVWEVENDLTVAA
jgi:osmotically-inducible protein OsmY